MKEKITVVVSVFNEEEVLNDFYDAAQKTLENCDADYEIIFVNDGSQDGSGHILKELSEKNHKVKVVEFARNFGHEAAMIAGIDYSSGDYIVCMDADLQHPPEIIPDIIEKFRQGYEIVSMVRTKNADAGLLNRIMSKAFYKLLNLFSPVRFENNSSDFFAVSGRVAEVLKKDYREKVRYLRGYVQSLGFDKTAIEFEAPKRFGGKSKYNFRKLLRFSIHTLCSFSDVPLKLGIYSGIVVAIFGLILMIYSIVCRFVTETPAGYATIISAICFLFAVTLFVIGVIGEYISIIFTEIKNRPIYIVKDEINTERKDGQDD